VRAIAQRNRRHRNIGLVMGRLSYGLIIFIGLLIALVIAIPGFTPGELISILGLSSVAIGFAFRDILQNFLAGILLLLSEPFRIGDQIVVGNFEGTVEDIQTRATFIRTYDGRRIVIPNSNLFTNSVTVNTANEKRRLQYDIGIGYGDDIAEAKRILLHTVREIPEVLDDPAPDALVVKLADSSINIRLRWWVQPPRQLDILNSQDVVLEKVANACCPKASTCHFRRSRFSSTTRPRNPMVTLAPARRLAARQRRAPRPSPHSGRLARLEGQLQKPGMTARDVMQRCGSKPENECFLSETNNCA
jgi:small-conductance mechanosensitive channel